MFKGHIDKIEDDRISGWAYSSHIALTGHRILVFDGEVCLGASTIELYRHDLEAAGLGDGRLGFEISCDAEGLMRARKPHLRLEGSDWQLPLDVDSDARLRDFLFSVQHLTPFSEEEAARLRWMASQGYLSQAEFTLAAALNSKGAYELTFSRQELIKTSVESTVSELLSKTLSAMFRHDIYPGSFKLSDFDSIESLRAATKSKLIDHQFIAILKSDAALHVAEGAHSPFFSSDEHSIVIHQLTEFKALICHEACLAELHSTSSVSALHRV